MQRPPAGGAAGLQVVHGCGLCEVVMHINDPAGFLQPLRKLKTEQRVSDVMNFTCLYYVMHPAVVYGIFVLEL
jgi:hypothetical protein